MHYDVIIVGGSFAGLSAALYLARARRSVCVVDTGKPRNRFASHSHGFFAQDGSDPRLMLATARAQLATYPGVTFIMEEAAKAARSHDGFSVTLDSGTKLTGCKLLLAFGIADILPDVPGLADRWGKSVIHCPYCHGYEFGGQKLGVLNISPMSEHQAMLISDWGPTTFYLNGAASPDDTTLEQLGRRNVRIEPAPVAALIGDGRNLSAVALQDGRLDPVAALFIGPRYSLNSPLASQLGCALSRTPLGSMVQVDERQLTSVPGVYAAGDIARGAHNVTFACADGVMAAMAMHGSLVFDAPGTSA